MTSTSNRAPGATETGGAAGRRALVIRIGALGDVILTRRLTYSLSLAGVRSTLLAPGRHASLLLGDPWIDAVLDSESGAFAPAFAGSWPKEARFDMAVLISNSADLEKAAGLAAAKVIRLPPEPGRDDVPIARQWAEAARGVCLPFTGALPPGDVDPRFGVQVFCLRERASRPQFVATNRHVSCGAMDVSNVTWTNDSIDGVSSVVAGDPYELYLTEPPGYAFVEALIVGAEVAANEKVGPLRRLRLMSARGGEVRWRLTYRTDAP